MDIKEEMVKIERIAYLTKCISNGMERVYQLEVEKRGLLDELIKDYKTTRTSFPSITPSTSPSNKRKQNLDNYIIKVMAPGAHMALCVIEAQVLEEGFVSNDKTFKTRVCKRLRERNDVTKIRRGVYMRRALLIPQE